MTAPARCLSGSFMDYSLPRAATMPSLRGRARRGPDLGQPAQGSRAAARAGITPALAVISNAIVDALSVYGIEHIEMPATAPSVCLGRDPRRETDPRT